MKLLDSVAFHGPSIHALEPALVHRVDFGAAVEWPARRLGAPFAEALLARLPELARREPLWASPGVLRPDLLAGEIMAHAALELQRLAMAVADLAVVRQTKQPGVHAVVHGFEDAEMGLRAGRLAFALILDVLAPHVRLLSRLPQGFSFAPMLERFVVTSREHSVDQTGLIIARAAARRGIPWFRLSPVARVLQLGHGHLQRRIDETVTDRTRATASFIARNKAVATQLLAMVGLPVPRQRFARSAAAAVRAAEQIGYPVVVKPNARGKGIGVAIGLIDAKQVEAAARRALEHDTALVVERFIEGEDHRLLVIDGKLAGAAKRLPAHVVGDGVHTVQQLIDAVNSDPRRGTRFFTLLVKIETDEEVEQMLRDVGLTPQSVPAAGQRVVLRRTANISTGGSPVDVTSVIHPDNRRMAECVAVTIGLDVAGVDFLTTDIARSYKEIGGAICEVNGSPGLRPHWVAAGGPDPVEPIIDMMFPGGGDGRIPVVAVTGTNGKTTTCQMAACILAAGGRKVGLATTNGVQIGGDWLMKGDWAGYRAARMILAHPYAEAAVLETARGGILRQGLGFDRCDVAAVTNLTEDHVGVDGVETLADLAAVKGLVVATARRAVVLNAEDAWCDDMIRRSSAERILLVAMSEDHPRLNAHVAAGGTVACPALRDGRASILLRTPGGEIAVAAADELPSTFGGRATYNVQNALFAAAIGHALGHDADTIRRGLMSLEPDFAQMPARTSIHDGNPFRVILDYGHNPASLRALRGFIERLDTAGRRIAVLQLPGNRRDEHFAAVCREVAGGFDRYICYRSDHLRGRGPEEVPQLLRAGLLAAGVPDGQIAIIPDQRAAIDAGLRMARPGDLVLVLVDNEIERCWQQITGFRYRDEARPQAP